MTARRRATIRLGAAVSGGLLVLAACSSSGSNGNGGGTGGGTGGSCKTATKKLNLAFVYTTTSLNPFQEMALGAKAAADQDGNVHLTESAPPTTDGPAEVSLFQAAMRGAADGIAYETVTPDLFVRPLKQADDAGIPLVAVDTAPPPTTEVKTFVGNSNTELGVQLGDAFVANHPDPNGTAVLGIDIPALQLLQQRMAGVQQVIKSKLPTMKIVGPLNSQNSPTDTYNAWKSFVNANPNATAFIGVGGEDGVALPLIQKQTGKRFLAGSADVPPQALQAVKDGYLFALSSPEHWMKGYIAIKLLIDAKRKCTDMPQGWWNSGSLLIDKSNIDSILARQKSPAARAQWFKPVADKQLANPPVKPLDQAD